MQAGSSGGSSRRPIASRPQDARADANLAARDVPDRAMGAKLGGGRVAGADGGARRQGRSGARRPRPRAPGPGRRMAEAGCRAQRCRVAGARQARYKQPRRPTRPGLPPSTRASPRSTSGLATDFPDYAALASPKPLSVEECRPSFGADEALVLFLDTPEWKPTPEETFIWVVTKTDMRWVRSRARHPALDARGGGAALRARRRRHLGRQRPRKLRRAARSSLLRSRLRERQAAALRPRPRARALQGAVRQVEDLIKGKHLLIVPSGPLTQLPFQVLVTESPTGSWPSRCLPRAAWLVGSTRSPCCPPSRRSRRCASVAKASHASRAHDRLRQSAARRRSPTGIAKLRQAAAPRQAALPRDALAAASPALAANGAACGRSLMRGGLADVAQIRVQVPAARNGGRTVRRGPRLGRRAATTSALARAPRRREIKRLSASGELAKYRIVHFATHGALAGQIERQHRAGLILTPPDKATEEDDGYLSASEIAALKLDADWVILSACNTAAGGATGAEALSGLARAFFYAGPRAAGLALGGLLGRDREADHGRDRHDGRRQGIGRAEAMRQSMLALIDNGAPDEAHPAYWAPFVVVGEGAARSH